MDANIRDIGENDSNLNGGGTCTNRMYLFQNNLGFGGMGCLGRVWEVNSSRHNFF